ncbi:MAG: hypothetical protein J7J78_04170 [Thermoprotei archaeon]|nr:hypothetical protein [Thermoprotei archaeon]
MVSTVYAELTENGKAIVRGEHARKLYSEGFGILKGDVLELEDVEVAYLAYRGTVKPDFKGEEVSLEKLFQILERNNPELPLMFTVYQDLRMRGRVVKPGYRRNVLLLYTKGAKSVADKAVYVVGEETAEFTIEELIKWITEALKLNKEPIVAIVDKHGDVTYYEVKKVELEKKG